MFNFNKKKRELMTKFKELHQAAKELHLSARTNKASELAKDCEALTNEESAIRVYYADRAKSGTAAHFIAKVEYELNELATTIVAESDGKDLTEALSVRRELIYWDKCAQLCSLHISAKYDHFELWAENCFILKLDYTYENYILCATVVGALDTIRDQMGVPSVNLMEIHDRIADRRLQNEKRSSSKAQKQVNLSKSLIKFDAKEQGVSSLIEHDIVSSARNTHTLVSETLAKICLECYRSGIPFSIGKKYRLTLSLSEQSGRNKTVTAKCPYTQKGMVMAMRIVQLFKAYNTELENTSVAFEERDAVSGKAARKAIIAQQYQDLQTQLDKDARRQ